MEMRIVVATDGRDDAVGALRMAHALAERRGATVEAVSAVPPFPFPASPVGEMATTTLYELDRQAAEDARAQIRRQLAALGARAADWPVTVELGAPPVTVARLAHAKAASLIVLGLGRHAVADRIFGSETALQVMRLAHVPVLAVPAEVRELPRTAVAAVDFSEFSRDAVETAAGILAPGATIHLAHVLGTPGVDMSWTAGPEWVASYHARIALQLDDQARRLEAAAVVQTRMHLMQGDPAREVLRLAKSVGADLMAAGSHGTGFFSRILMGSVSTRLVRGASCAVLIAPPHMVPTELDRLWQERAEGVAVHAGAATSEG